MDTKERKAMKRKKKKISLEMTVRVVARRQFFWCNRDGNFMYITACINRQDLRKEGCMSCAQGRVVREAYMQKHADDGNGLVKRRDLKMVPRMVPIKQKERRRIIL